MLIERRLLDLAFEVLYLGTAIYNPRLLYIDWKNIVCLFFFVKVHPFVKINKMLIQERILSFSFFLSISSTFPGIMELTSAPSWTSSFIEEDLSTKYF